jgi:dolichol-phosphate mannosyltransferase|tara:strand:- start:166 stop:438 length:273 start_codon:yes stop_codon:yes gene_type:complete
MPITVQSLAEWQTSSIEGMLSVVVPAHNEKHHIEETISQFAKTLDRENIGYEILVINDNSTDRTQEILQRLSLCNQNFNLAQLETMLSVI